MTRKQKKTLRRIIVSAVLYVLLLVIGAEHRGWLGLALFLIPYAVIGWDVLWRAVRNISNGQVFDENFLMAVATVGALAAGSIPRPWPSCCFTRWGSCSRAWPSPAAASPSLT